MVRSEVNGMSVLFQTTCGSSSNWKYFLTFLVDSFFYSSKFSTDVGGERLGWCRWRLEHLSHGDYNVVLE